MAKGWVMDNFNYFETSQAFHGVVCPLMANAALWYRKASPALVKVLGNPRYADDLVVVHHSHKVIQQAQQVLSKWLQKMGLGETQQNPHLPYP